MTQDFGALRALLQQPASYGVWQDLCLMAQSWDPEDWTNRAGPYAKQHIERWPDGLRTIPAFWFETLRTGALPQGAHLLRELTVYPAMDLEQIPQELDVSTLTALIFSDPEKSSQKLAPIAQWPELTALRSLSVNTKKPDATLTQTLLTALVQNIPALHTLELSLKGLSVSNVRTIAEHAHARGLQDLRLQNNKLDHTHAYTLGPHIGGLRKLDVSNNPLTLMGLSALIEDRAHPWTTLHVDSTEQGPLAPALIAKHLHALTYVDLDFNDLGRAQAWTMLAEHDALPWKALSLRSTRQNYDDLYTLSRAQSLPHLNHLNLSLNTLDDRRWGAVLASASMMPTLETLGLDHTYMDHQGLHQFCQKLGPNALKRLSLRSSGLDDRCVEWLAQAEHLGGLTILDLQGNTITGRGWRALAESPHMSAEVRLRAKRYLL